MATWTFGTEGYFNTDIAIATYCLDEQALLQQKYCPMRLEGRAIRNARSEALGRFARAQYNMRNAEPVILDIADDEPDVVGDKFAEKAKHRAHRSASRYEQVRRVYDPWDNKALKQPARRTRRRQLNKLAETSDMDVVREYRSYFADAEPMSIRGIKCFCI